jgi:hypothetical protein
MFGVLRCQGCRAGEVEDRRDFKDTAVGGALQLVEVVRELRALLVS